MVQNITKIFIFGPLEMELLRRSNQILEQDSIINSQQIGIHLSTNFFLPFELISIILLIALIGAITVACQY
ncbi:hypothetical protein RHMOL_Rhmol13G0152100 [Rhododendron molle]|uniref:Uncharacterized protein n=1 Tax=Rhododendron molle TaxID=49168 RepID=A0ACC0L7G7_RHOML|nr:hypothetical protein RHMOL_Rhmol13G0152100 [Rhododendron molle]